MKLFKQKKNFIPKLFKSTVSFRNYACKKINFRNQTSFFNVIKTNKSQFQMGGSLIAWQKIDRWRINDQRTSKRFLPRKIVAKGGRSNKKRNVPQRNNEWNGRNG